VTLGGKRHALGGRFFEPTILTGVTKAMKVSTRRRSGRWRRSSASRTKPT
jgi:succinate-semialdehyde dehydrogenase/glutarate-semialdehyde dehydrogenase